MVDTVRTQAQLLSFLHPNIGNAMPDATVLQAQAARDLIVSVFPLFPNGVDPNGVGIAPGGVVPPQVPVAGEILSVLHGSPTHKVTTNSATMYVSREMNNSAGSDINAAGWFAARNSGTTQPVAVMAQAFGQGDTVALYGVGKNSANHGGAFGIFLFAEAETAGGGAIAVGTEVLNLTGVNQPYTAEIFVAADLVYDAAGSGHYAGEAVLIRAGTPGDRWDAGIWVNGDVIRTVTLQDDSNALSSIVISGDHADAGIKITNNAGHYMNKWIRTTGAAAAYGLAFQDGAGRLTFDDINAGISLLQINSGAPLANSTSLYLAEGIGATMRRVAWKAGNTLVAGDLVMVLV